MISEHRQILINKNKIILINRYQDETRLLHRYAKWARWYNGNQYPLVEGSVSNKYGDPFVLRIEIGTHFPHQEPQLYIMSPRRLPKYGSGYVNDEGVLMHFIPTRMGQMDWFQFVILRVGIHR